VTPTTAAASAGGAREASSLCALGYRQARALRGAPCSSPVGGPPRPFAVGKTRRGVAHLCAAASAGPGSVTRAGATGRALAGRAIGAAWRRPPGGARPYLSDRARPGLARPKRGPRRPCGGPRARFPGSGAPAASKTRPRASYWVCAAANRPNRGHSVRFALSSPPPRRRGTTTRPAPSAASVTRPSVRWPPSPALRAAARMAPASNGAMGPWDVRAGKARS